MLQTRRWTVLRARSPEQEVKRNVGAMGAKPEPVPQAPARGQHLLRRIPSHSEADPRSDPDQMQGIMRTRYPLAWRGECFQRPGT